MNKNPYEVLGVARDASDADIKKAYHKLVMKYHPDRNPGDKAAEEKFKEVNNAFDILKDPQKRAAYDRFGDAAFAGGNASGANPFGAGANPFGNGAFHFNMGGGAGMDDILREAMRGFGFDMGGGARGENAQRRGRDLLDDVSIDLRDAYFGTTHTVKFTTNVECDKCHGARYNDETLAVKYKGKSIADVLNMTVEEAYRFFSNVPQIARKLELLKRVGLDYIKLGQSSLDLSGGEAQRIKLSKELAARSTGQTIYILDEPTTGLHFADIKLLLSVLHELVDQGNTVIVIEHNLEVIKTADWIIDLGPGGGAGGGRVVAVGTPEQVAENPESLTGKYLQKYLDNGKKKK